MTEKTVHDMMVEQLAEMVKIICRDVMSEAADNILSGIERRCKELDNQIKLMSDESLDV